MTVKLRLQSKKEKINRKKKKMMMYLSKGLKVNEATILADVTKQELLEMRSDVEFEDFVQKSQALLEMEQLENITDQGTVDWKASAWLLERLYPDRYGKKDTIEYKYEIKLVTFQNVVLSVINECAPQLKQRIMQKLKTIDTDNHALLEHHSKVHVEEHTDKIIDADFSDD